MSAVVHHGDCLDVMPTLGVIDAIVTDPPYGLGSTPSRRRPSNWQRADGMEPRQWDTVAPDVRWLLDLAPCVAVWGGNYFDLPRSRGWLVWCKPDAMPSMGSVEMCWTNLDRTAKHISYSVRAGAYERCGHPTQKPLAVMARTLEFLKLSPDSLIVDPYCGSGTTGVAAIRAGYRFIGIEREAAFVGIARKRIADAQAQGSLFTGGAA